MSGGVRTTRRQVLAPRLFPGIFAEGGVVGGGAGGMEDAHLPWMPPTTFALVGQWWTCTSYQCPFQTQKPFKSQSNEWPHLKSRPFSSIQGNSHHPPYIVLPRLLCSDARTYVRAANQLCLYPGSLAQPWSSAGLSVCLLNWVFAPIPLGISRDC